MTDRTGRLCGIPAQTFPACDLEWGHAGYLARCIATHRDEGGE